MQGHWNDGGTEFSFETEELRGVLVADCGSAEPQNNRHRIRDLVHKPSGVRVTPEGGMMEQAGSFTLFRCYAHDAWLTELRSLEPVVTRHDDGATLLWPPKIEHQVRTTARFIVREPNLIDVDLSVEGYCHYPDYELLFSNYVAPDLKGNLFVTKNPLGGGDCERICVTDNPAFHGMYNFFPRDERAAHTMTDGRGQRGRWYWRPACGRPYAYPMGCACNDGTSVLLMGRPEDVSGVGVTYSAEGDNYDGVAKHHALYLSLFCRDLSPGEAWRTQVRLAVCDGVTDRVALDACDSFLSEVASIPRSFEIGPHQR